MPPGGGQVNGLPGLLQSLSELAEQPETALDPEARLPGGPGVLELTPEEEAEIARYLRERLREHDDAVRPFWDVRREIDNAYGMIPDPTTQGVAPGSARLCSELTKSHVDQAKARTSAALLGVKPLMRVVGPDETAESSVEDGELFERTERFLEDWAFGEMGLRNVLEQKNLRATRLGTAVTRDMWEVREERYYHLGPDGEVVEEVERNPTIRLDLIPYQDFVLWPLNITDWQRDYELVGHRTHLTPPQFEERMRTQGVAAERIERVLAFGGERTADEHTESQHRARDVDVQAAQNHGRKLTTAELWFHGALPNGLFGKLTFLLHEESETLLAFDFNPLYCQQHPYRPLRYKRVDGWAFGEGIGDELRFMQKAMSTLDNMEVDNLKVVGNHVIALKEDSGADNYIQQIGPGFRFLTEDPKNDINVFALGASLTHIYEAKAHVQMRATNATGMAPVLQGQGDQTLKSGATATAVLQLVSEAGKKFGDVDSSLRADLEDEAMFWLELIQQYAPEGLFYKRMPVESARVLERLKWVPPRGRLRSKLRLRVTAPSAATNRETLKQQIVQIYGMAVQHLAGIERLASEVYQFGGDVTGLIALKREMVLFVNELFAKILELHDLGSFVPKTPELREPTPPEVIINQLYQRLMQLQAALAQAGGGPLGGPAPLPGAGPPAPPVPPVGAGGPPPA